MDEQLKLSQIKELERWQTDEYNKLISIAFATLKNHDDAEDVIAHVMYNMLRLIHLGTVFINMDHYICHAVKRSSIGYCRDNLHVRDWLPIENIDISTTYEPGWKILKKMEIKKCIDRLTYRQRITVGGITDGYTHKEIASVTYAGLSRMRLNEKQCQYSYSTALRALRGSISVDDGIDMGSDSTVITTTCNLNSI